MFKFDIQIDKGTLRRWNSASTRLINRVNHEKNDLPYRCAVSFRDLVFKKIMAGEFSHPPYSKRYAEFKEDYGNKGPWRLHDNLVESLTVFKMNDGDGWLSGIPAGVSALRISMFGGKSKMVPIALYARTLEYALDVQKKRPVFVPTTKEFRENGFPEEVKKSAEILRQAWR